jgi:hypothetical protein
LIFSSHCYAGEKKYEDNDYGQFVDIENYTSKSSRPCQQEKAQNFLQTERDRFELVVKIAKKQGTVSCLVDATIELYFATEIATQNYLVEQGVSSKKNQIEDYIRLQQAQFRINKINILQECPACISGWIVKKKADFLIWRLLEKNKKQKIKKE